MKIYLVGGAVRDELLNRPVIERDWVVVGETQASMLAANFLQVGKDFPVFLHPKTKEEYALARKERKVAKGYHGFEFDATASVTLEEDLMRRDLTINAIAKDESGILVDPYDGIKDLAKKVLRHVSPAFSEDPVRILRVARFSARFADFTVAKETNDLMKDMVAQGEVDALVVERVWKEFEKAMSEIAPWRFIEVLENCHALEILFLIFKSKKLEVIACLKKISVITLDAFERIVLMLQAAHAPMEVNALCLRYRAPNAFLEMVHLIEKHQKWYENCLKNTASEMLELFVSLDAFRRKERFKQWVRLCRVNLSVDYSSYLLEAFDLVSKIDIPKQFLEKNNGKAIGEYIENQRLEKLVKFVSQYRA